MTDESSTGVGLYYKVLGVIALLGTLVLFSIQVFVKHSLTVVDAVVYGILVVLILALIRPEFFDDIMKTVGDKLPFGK